MPELPRKKQRSFWERIMSNYNQKLLAIQWIAENRQFNEHQRIQLGDAITAFHDCIKENEELRELLDLNGISRMATKEEIEGISKH